MKYKTIDLCAGIGGIRRGFEMTGCFENVLSAEIDPYAAKTYKHLFGDDPTNNLTSEIFKSKVCQTQYDVLLAGFPCQTFSRAGKKMGFKDTTKGTIFYEIADIISRTKPKAVFLENVENLVSHDKGQTIDTIVTTLEDELKYRIIGVEVGKEGQYKYSAKSFVRNSRYFGIPQNRPRAYIMAFSKEYYGEAIKRLKKGLPEKSDKVIFENINAVLDTNVADQYYMAEGYLETLKRHKEREKAKGHGFGYCVVNQKTDLTANTILATGGSGKERNLIFQPKNGVAGKKLPRKRTKINDEGIRVMTPTEWGRLQGFIGYGFLDNDVEKFSFPEEMPEGQKYKQFGNSVTIPVIEKMALFMKECFEELEKDPEDVVRSLLLNRSYITSADLIDIIKLSSSEAAYFMNRMCKKGVVKQVGNKRGTRYISGENG